jgi:hypothetical protein
MLLDGDYHSRTLSLLAVLSIWISRLTFSIVTEARFAHAARAGYLGELPVGSMTNLFVTPASKFLDP